MGVGIPAFPDKRDQLATCRHCGLPCPPGAEYCCHGCELAAALLKTEGLERFYELRAGDALPVAERPLGGTGWLERALEDARRRAAAGPLTITVDVEGITCAACVWVIETLFERRDGARSVLVNPARGQMTMTFLDTREDEGLGEGQQVGFDVQAFLADLATLGYRTGPARRTADSEGDDLLLRVGVTFALAMNVMILSLAFYFGLAPTEGFIPEVFAWVAFGLSTLSLMLGLPVFAKGAIGALKRGAIHLDLPIALGMALAWIASVAEGALALSHDEALDAGYFDTLAIFIALVLLGRWLQRRAVSRNRRLVLDATPEAALHVRRVSADGVAIVPADDIDVGDKLLITPGDHLPVRALALEPSSGLSFAWISGESAPVGVTAGDELPAGAHHRGDQAFVVEALETLEDSALFTLLQAAPKDDDSAAGGHRIAKLYVLAVLTLATVGALGWGLTDGLAAGLDVAVAVLVVSCPCALGLALPLARELSVARLRQQGLLIRRADIFDRLAEVSRVVFDKTGTLTSRRLRLAEPASLLALSDDDLHALSQMVLRSRHPASAALLDALAQAGRLSALDGRAAVVEEPGTGLRLTLGEQQYLLGRPREQAATTAVALRRGSAEIAVFHLEEALRYRAGEEIERLQAGGLEVEILSGDQQARVTALADQLGIDPQLARGGQSPADKASHLSVGAPTLMLGDGLNDGPALDAAHVAGAMPGEDGALAERADFFLLGEGLAPLGALFEEQHRFQTVIRRNLVFALSYNVVIVGLALAGLMSPVLAAISMPISSINVVAHTGWALRPRVAFRPARRGALPPLSCEVPA